MTSEPFVFNPYAPGYDADPSPVYRHLREHAPVYWWERGQAFLISKYQDLMETMRDPRFSRSARDGKNFQAIPDHADFHELKVASENSILVIPPPDHLRMRRLLNPIFSPRAAERLGDETRDVTLRALAEVPRADVVNLAALADYIPLRVIGRLLDIPPEKEDGFLEFARARMALVSPALSAEQRVELMRAVASGYSDVRRLIEERRLRPGADFLSTLIHHEDAGVRLSDAELLGLVGAIVIGGSDTTVHTIRFMILNLLRHPAQLARVRREPSLARAVMEETLRFDHFNRLGQLGYALEDVTVRGVTIQKGQTVIFLTGAGTRDPEVFAQPDVFDIERNDLSRAHNFGVGPHTCLGIHLARLEADVVLPLILDRFPEMSLAGPPEYSPHTFFRVMSKLPVRVRRTAA